MDAIIAILQEQAAVIVMIGTFAWELIARFVPTAKPASLIRKALSLLGVVADLVDKIVPDKPKVP